MILKIVLKKHQQQQKFQSNVIQYYIWESHFITVSFEAHEH